MPDCNSSPVLCASAAIRLVGHPQKWGCAAPASVREVAPGPKDRITATDHRGHMDPDDTVIDLGERRRSIAGTAPIPDHVRDEMEAAAQLWHELRAERKELRFDGPDDRGRFRTVLGDLDGPERRIVSLHEALVPYGDDGPDAAA
jgi:hypothetical protein